MKESEFIEKKNLLIEEKKQMENDINVRYTEILKKFLDANCPVEEGKVYEIVDKGGQSIPKGMKRIVIYDRGARTWPDEESSVMITVAGWFLNENNVPSKWKNFTVAGIGNPTVMKLSENQIALPHPDADKPE